MVVGPYPDLLLLSPNARSIVGPGWAEVREWPWYLNLWWSQQMPINRSHAIRSSPGQQTPLPSPLPPRLPPSDLHPEPPSSTSPSPSPQPAVSPAAILQSWSALRDPSSSPSSLLSSLRTLSLLPPPPSTSPTPTPTSSSPSSPPSPPPPPPSLPSSPSSPPGSSNPSPLPSPPPLHPLPPPLLGALSSPSPPSPSPSPSPSSSSAPSPPPPPSPPSRAASLDLFASALRSHLPALASHAHLLPETLAAIGYALSRADDARFVEILTLLLRIWEAGAARASLSHGLMLLRLVEWCVLRFLDSRATNKVEALCRELAPEKCEANRFAPFAVVMACCGALRALRLASSKYRIEFDPRLRESLEGSIGFAAKEALAGIGSNYNAEGTTTESVVLLHSAARSISSSMLLRISLRDANGNPTSHVGSQVKEHLTSFLFKEAGAVTGVFCNQYSSADDDARAVVEHYMWEYSQVLYSNLRAAVFVLRGKKDKLLGELEKIAEAAFLMVVVFAAEVTKHKLNPKSSHDFQPEMAVRILVAFSCIEYLRRARLPEYTDVVRRAVLTVQENTASCGSFVESMPPYRELTKEPGSLTLDGTRYDWSKDEVQTARMLFYLRVIPTCIGLVPASMFANKVASIMFLYMQHPNEKVTRASHSVLVSFLSSVNVANQDEQLALKEQLIFYYMRRALEAYPGVTPFEGLASGVAALVRHLPAGSPAIFYCVHCLVVKATDLCRKAMSQDETLWKSWESSSEPCKKVVDLLLRLISLVDIQVLPYLLKQLAGFITQLPEDGQNVLLDDMYSQVAESDDVTRKPVLVSWLQSLSYITSKEKLRRKSHDKARDYSRTSSKSLASIDGLSARL
uniref:Uncharacterized protein n=1 Tax=Ananas comosus var. bracteatus TaxID=296719 RepID=A0A6V7QC79_ANACO|nr:unnamed protein product [Ananas comosus var. bracteatus]